MGESRGCRTLAHGVATRDPQPASRLLRSSRGESNPDRQSGTLSPSPSGSAAWGGPTGDRTPISALRARHVPFVTISPRAGRRGIEPRPTGLETVRPPWPPTFLFSGDDGNRTRLTALTTQLPHQMHTPPMDQAWGGRRESNSPVPGHSRIPSPEGRDHQAQAALAAPCIVGPFGGPIPDSQSVDPVARSGGSLWWGARCGAGAPSWNRTNMVRFSTGCLHQVGHRSAYAMGAIDWSRTSFGLVTKEVPRQQGPDGTAHS